MTLHKFLFAALEQCARIEKTKRCFVNIVIEDGVFKARAAGGRGIYMCFKTEANLEDRVAMMAVYDQMVALEKRIKEDAKAEMLGSIKDSLNFQPDDTLKFLLTDGGTTSLKEVVQSLIDSRKVTYITPEELNNV